MKPILANLIGAGSAGVALAAGLLLGAPASAGGPSQVIRPGAPERLGDGSDEIPLADAMEIWGQPARLGVFFTTDETAKVAETYASAWRDAGLQPTVRTLGRVVSVSVLDKSSGLMRSVSIMEAGDERMVVPALMDVRTVPDFSARAAPVPIPENARAYLSQVADDSTSVGFHANFLLPLSPARAVEFYRVELTKLGYKERANSFGPMSKGAAGLEFERDQESIIVVATPTEEKSEGETAFVVVTHTRAIDAGEVEETP